MPPAERFEHGTRARYTSGCHCTICKAANTAYQRTRAKAKVYGRTNGLVPVAPVRRHLIKLQRAGIGRRTIADVSKVADSIVGRILEGTKKHVREATARRLLEVTRDVLADGALVPAGPVWTQLERLLAEGFTRGELARRLGSTAKRPALQLRRDQVLASTAAKVDRFYRSIMT